MSSEIFGPLQSGHQNPPIQRVLITILLFLHSECPPVHNTNVMQNPPKHWGFCVSLIMYYYVNLECPNFMALRKRFGRMGQPPESSECTITIPFSITFLGIFSVSGRVSSRRRLLPKTLRIPHGTQNSTKIKQYFLFFWNAQNPERFCTVRRIDLTNLRKQVIPLVDPDHVQLVGRHQTPLVGCSQLRTVTEWFKSQNPKFFVFWAVDFPRLRSKSMQEYGESMRATHNTKRFYHFERFAFENLYLNQ